MVLRSVRCYVDNMRPTPPRAGAEGAAAQEVESALCDVLVSLDLDRDGRVGAADVNAWWREEKP